jgi:SAM-dependent methyltransferase
VPVMNLRASVCAAAVLVSAGLLSPCPSLAQESDYFTKKLAPSVGSPEHAVDKMLEAAQLKPGETLYDLGCGDGRILVKAAKKYKVNAVGIEISLDLAEQAAADVRKRGLQDQVKIIHGNFLKTDLSAANVVTLYLAPSANDALRPNLERELRPRTRVVSYDYPIDGWTPLNTWKMSGHLGEVHVIYLYRVPDSIKK